MVVFLQFQVQQVLKDERMVAEYRQRAADNFRRRFPRVHHLWEIFEHLKKEFLVLFSFVIFFMMIILTTKSVINWGFQIILCVFIITYIGVNNRDTQAGSGIKRLSRVWFLIIWYSSAVLLLQITYQFAALPVVREALEIDQLLAALPEWVRRNIGILGFTVYTTFIWEKFLIYLLYFALGVYVRKQMRAWEQQDIKHRIQQKQEVLLQLNNSDMQQDYFEADKEVDWRKEYLKIRFSTPYLVYKIRKVWLLLDKIS